MRPYRKFRLGSLSVDGAVVLIRWLIRPVGWLVRPQWFVKNVALVPMTNEPSVPPGVVVRVGSPDDAAALAPLLHGRESLARRFARGDVVLVAELDHQVVGCTWLTTRPLRPSYFPIRVRPQPGEWYNYGLVLLPQYRVRGLGRTLSRMAMTEVRRRGGRLMFGHALRFDRIAAASHAAAGFVAIKELIGLNVLNRFVVLLARRPRATLPNSAVPPDRDPLADLSECERIQLGRGT